ncbi:hypothetical protein [Rhodococcus sp. HS-D2]|uniref:hypothetical protein n=1 Tax=Rhodococcus sp. HS-D2 TaxID=1384636 RepID=UPI0007D9D9EC|nr:hypothetical protein [Rhodococcus sp. HS-D2]
MANQPIYIDPALTNVANAWVNSQESFIADKLFPVVPVSKPTFKVPEYGKENLELIENTTRTGLSKAKSVSYTRKYKDGKPLAEHALSGEVTKDDYELSDDPFTPESDTTEFILERMALVDEKNLADYVTNLSNVPGTALSGASRWSNPSADPLNDIRVALAHFPFRKPNTISLSQDSFLQLVSHPSVLDKFKWAVGGAVGLDQLKQLLGGFGITNVLIGQARANLAAEGLTEDINEIWGSDVLLAYVTPKPSRKEINGGYKFTLENGRKVRKNQIFDPEYTKIVVEDYYNYELLLPEAFYTFKNAFADWE